MAQILVRNLDERVVKRLKECARRQGRSLQSEVKRIIEQAVTNPGLDMRAARKLSARLRRKLKGRRFPDVVKSIREERAR
ncbi:MAG TPA: Arc family DNA-binding protein [Planctomycetota bacterium]|nr:Arc family DNA-binding protein [Planctomycetota bacterium]